MSAPAEENWLERRIREVVRANPDLNYGGWRTEGRRPHLTDEEHAEKRRKLLAPSTGDEVAATLAYLSWRTIRARATSYGLKHAAERRAGIYVSNGSAIVGAIIGGYEVRRGLNPYINCGFKKPRGDD